MATGRQLAGKAIRRLFTSQRSFRWARLELQCAWQVAKNAVDPRYHARLRDLAKRKGLSLNVGAAGIAPGADWVLIDAFPHPNNTLTLDLRRPLPLQDQHARRIYASHVLEHLDFRDDVPRALREFHRILEPGGVLRIVVPDARRYVEAYLSADPEKWHALGWDPEILPDDIYTPMHIVNHVFHQNGEHMFGYDFETLRLVLETAGFDCVVEQRFQQSLDPELAIDSLGHARYSLYVDAAKSRDSVRGA